MIDSPKIVVHDSTLSFCSSILNTSVPKDQRQETSAMEEYYYNFQINQSTMTTVEIHPQPKTKKVKFFHDASTELATKISEDEKNHTPTMNRDVKIYLGGGLVNVEDQKGKGYHTSSCIRWHYSSVLSSRSQIIRQKIAPVEKVDTKSTQHDPKEYCLRLPFLSVQVWDLMMKFLDFPAKQDEMTIQQALALAPYYDAYGFDDGLNACDVATKDYMESLSQQEKDLTLNVGLLVDALAVASSITLPQAYRVGARYVKKKLLSNDFSTYGCLMFSRDHLQQLVPLITKEVESDPEFRKSFPFKTKASVKNDLFPGYYLNYTIGNHALSMVSQALNKLVVLGSDEQTTNGEGAISCSSLNGIYRRQETGKLPQAHISFEKQRNGMWNNQPVVFSIQFIPQKGWFILARPQVASSVESDLSPLKQQTVKGTVLWMSPQSHSTVFPPKASWKPLSTSAVGDLRIEYVYG